MKENIELESLKEKKKCFVIMPISDIEGYENGHFSRVYEHLIKPACLQAGFEPNRADKTDKANFIIVDILQQILDCEIAICDLSARNANVFYELGIRQAFNKKTILIVDNDTQMPFDISGIRAIPYDKNLRIDNVEKCISKISACIKETLAAKTEDVNSLIQLLGIKPARITNSIELSQDSSIILKAITDLSNKLSYNKTYNYPYSIIVENLFNGSIQKNIEIYDFYSIQETLNDIYFLIEDFVPPFTYLQSWILREKISKTNLVIYEITKLIKASEIFKPNTICQIVLLDKSYNIEDSIRMFKH